MAAHPETPEMAEKEKLLQLGRAVVETEAEAVTGLLPRIDDNFFRACRHILDCSGRTVVTGMGKSGHIGRKIAATLASTGTPAFSSIPARPATATWV